MKNKSILLIALAFVLMFQFIATDSAVACPTCKDGMSNSVAFGYAISILFMMSMPFTILGFWFVTIRRLRREMANRSVPKYN